MMEAEASFDTGQRITLELAAGPLGVEVEPAERQRGGYAIGCRITGFKRSDDAAVGQVEATGQVPAGALIAAIDSQSTLAMSFDKIMALLMHGGGKPRRTFDFLLPEGSERFLETPTKSSDPTRDEQVNAAVDSEAATSDGRLIRLPLPEVAAQDALPEEAPAEESDDEVLLFDASASSIGNPDGYRGYTEGSGDRLAAALAKRLNAERARRFRLEEVTELQAEQIALLQKQANRSAMLEDLLADERHLSAALRDDRQRLEDELTRALTALADAAAVATANAPEAFMSYAESAALREHERASVAEGLIPSLAHETAVGEELSGTRTLREKERAAAAASSVSGLEQDASEDPGLRFELSSPPQKQAAPAVAAAAGSTAADAAGAASGKGQLARPPGLFYPSSENGSADTEAVGADESLTPPSSTSASAVAHRTVHLPAAAASVSPMTDVTRMPAGRSGGSSGSAAAAALAEVVAHLQTEKEAWVEERANLRRELAAAEAAKAAAVDKTKQAELALLEGEGPRLASLRRDLYEKAQQLEFEAASSERLAAEVQRLNGAILAKELEAGDAAAAAKQQARQLWDREVEIEQLTVEVRVLRESANVSDAEQRLIADKSQWTRERNELLKELAGLRERLAKVDEAALQRLREDAAAARAVVRALQDERDMWYKRANAAREALANHDNPAAARTSDERASEAAESDSAVLEAKSSASSALLADERRTESPIRTASPERFAVVGAGCSSSGGAFGAVAVSANDATSPGRRTAPSITATEKGVLDLSSTMADDCDGDSDRESRQGSSEERVEELLEQLEDLKDLAREGEAREQRVKDDADAAIRRLEALVTAPPTSNIQPQQFLQPSSPLYDPVAAAAAPASAAAAAAAAAVSIAALRGQLDNARALADEREWDARRSERQMAEAKREAQRASAAEAAAERRCRAFEREATSQKRALESARVKLVEAEETVAVLSQRLKEKENALATQPPSAAAPQVPQQLPVPAPSDQQHHQQSQRENAVDVATLRASLAAQEAELADIRTAADAAIASDAAASSSPPSSLSRSPAALAYFRGVGGSDTGGGPGRGSVLSRVLELRAAWERRGYQLQRAREAADEAASAAASEAVALRAKAEALRSELDAARSAATSAASASAAAAAIAASTSSTSGASYNNRRNAAGHHFAASEESDRLQALVREKEAALRERARQLQSAVDKADAAAAASAAATSALATLEGVLDAAAAAAGAVGEEPSAPNYGSRKNTEATTDFQPEAVPSTGDVGSVSVERRGRRAVGKALCLVSAQRRCSEELAKVRAEAAAQQLRLQEDVKRLEAALAARVAVPAPLSPPLQLPLVGPSASSLGAKPADGAAQMPNGDTSAAAAALLSGPAKDRSESGSFLEGFGATGPLGLAPLPHWHAHVPPVLAQLRGEIEEVRRRNDGLRKGLRYSRVETNV